jgi:hypothetical protein
MLYAQGNNNSPSASDPAVILLDFDGHEVKATPWNWNGSFYAEPTLISERQIREIIDRVETDYDIFNVKVTFEEKEYLKANPLKRIRVIVTPTSSWYGIAGGVALIGSFTWGDDTPCFVFSDQLNFKVKFIAEAISHEVGHTLGLQHQSEYDQYCNKVQEYNQGKGDSTGWAPIMGTGYFKSLTTWAIGQSTEDCSVIQDDLYLLSQLLEYKQEAAGNDSSQIPELIVRGFQVRTSGYIRTAHDQDRYILPIKRPTRITLIVTPGNEERGAVEPNLNIKLQLTDQHGQTIFSRDLPNELSASLDTTLQAGNYVVSIEGAPTDYLPDYGSIGAYIVHGFVGVTLPVHRFELKGHTSGHVHTLNWDYFTDEDIDTVRILQSDDGHQFHIIKRPDPELRSAVVIPGNNNKSYYKVELISRSGEVFVSNIISLQNRNTSGTRPYAYISGNEIVVYSIDHAPARLYSPAGNILFQTNLSKGFNRIPMQQNWKGLLILQVQTQKQPQSFRLINW